LEKAKKKKLLPVYGFTCFKALQTRMIGSGAILNKIYYYYDTTKHCGIDFPSSIIYA